MWYMQWHCWIFECLNNPKTQTQCWLQIIMLPQKRITPVFCLKFNLLDQCNDNSERKWRIRKCEVILAILLQQCQYEEALFPSLFVLLEAVTHKDPRQETYLAKANYNYPQSPPLPLKTISELICCLDWCRWPSQPQVRAINQLRINVSRGGMY